MHTRYEARLKQCAAFVAAFAASAAVTLGVTALFDSASRTPWLRDTPAARAAFADCAARDGRAARDRCLHQAVAAAQARDAGRTQLAQAAASPK